MDESGYDGPFTVYLIRHAQPVQDAGMRYDVPPGPSLSNAGRVQAHMAASFLQSNPPWIVYTSPLDRALQTAHIIAAQLDVPLALDERLAEHRHQEPNEQVMARVADFWRQRVDQVTSRCIALVSHGSPIKAMLSMLGDVLVADPNHYGFDAGNIVPHAGIWRARRLPHHRWQVALIFRTLTLNVAPAHSRRGF